MTKLKKSFKRWYKKIIHPAEYYSECWANMMILDMLHRKAWDEKRDIQDVIQDYCSLCKVEREDIFV